MLNLIVQEMEKFLMMSDDMEDTMCFGVMVTSD
jgi:hypothetical protein